MIDPLLVTLHQRLISLPLAADLQALREHVLACWPIQPEKNRRMKKTVHQPAVDYLDQALSIGEVSGEKEICRLLRGLAPYLSWNFGYQPHPDFPRLAEQVAFSPLIGPDDVWISSQLAIGLTLIAPETLYPAHHHQAAEIYLPLSGTGLWSMGNTEFHPRKPGELIIHHSHVPHATQAQHEPVLALYIWHGELASPSEWL
ncbi:dimethylsulfonioproprionate lyase family protein [Erwinia sp. V71]|uniref:dimethylsulfonioproprionate lyase family protein n=1 Tax=Erwinia sp. V71 TaxID=3369424 RepID=UPI003F5FA562